MPQIFFKYQLVLDQFKGGGDSGRIAQVFSGSTKTGVLELKMAFSKKPLYNLEDYTKCSVNVNKGLY